MGLFENAFTLLKQQNVGRLDLVTVPIKIFIKTFFLLYQLVLHILSTSVTETESIS